jgi:hypothetical protein
MKKLFLLTGLVLLLVACAPTGQGAVQTSVAVTVPEALNVIIGTLMFTLVTAGFVYIFEKWGLDLRGYATGLAATLSGILIAALQHVINIIPAQYDTWVTMVLQILVIVLGGIGVLRLYAGKQAKDNGLLNKG